MKLKEAKAVSPVTMDELFSKYNTYERTPEAFQAAIDQATAKIDDLTQQAAQGGSKVDVLKVLDGYNQEIKRLTKLAPTSDTAAQQLAELSRRKDMFIQAIGGESSTPLNVGVGKVKEIKKAFQGDMPETSFGKPQSELNKAGGTKIAYKGLIKGIEEAAPGTKEVGREQAALIKLKKIAENQTSRAGAKQVFNFTKLGSAGLGGVLAGVPGAIAGFATEQLLNHPLAIKFGSKLMKKVGQFLQGKDPSILKSTYGIYGNDITSAMVEKVIKSPEFQKAYTGAQKEAQGFKDIMREVSGGRKSNFDLKKSSTAAEKVIRKHMMGQTGFVPADLQDIIRGNIIGANEADVQSILAAIKKKYPEFPIEDYFTTPNKAGYRGYNVAVTTPGGKVGELQIHTPETLERQNAIHPIYDEWRNVLPKKKPAIIDELSRKKAVSTEKIAKVRNNVFRKASKTAKFGYATDTKR